MAVNRGVGSDAMALMAASSARTQIGFIRHISIRGARPVIAPPSRRSSGLHDVACNLTFIQADPIAAAGRS